MMALLSPPPTAETLFRLHCAHLTVLPFENLSVSATDGPMANTLDGAWAKLVTSRRGGWCLEHNAVLAAACTHLGYTVTPRPGWILRRERRAAADLFGVGPARGGAGGDCGGGGDGDGAAEAGDELTVAPTLPSRHLVLEVGVPDGGTYLVDGGNGRSFAFPLPLRNVGGGWTADAAGGGAIAQPDGTWWRVVGLDADPALTALAAAEGGAGSTYRLVQYAVADDEGTSSRVRGNSGGGGREDHRRDQVVATPPSDPAAWTSYYVMDTGSTVARLADMDGVRDYFQFDAASPFRKHRLLTLLTDGGRSHMVLVDRRLKVVTYTPTAEGDPDGDRGGVVGHAGGGTVTTRTTEVGGDEAAWAAAVDAAFGVRLEGPGEAARLARAAPLPVGEAAEQGGAGGDEIFWSLMAERGAKGR
ncbi:hypothetical protein MMPV_006604 [Pyropia vietnamensis]